MAACACNPSIGPGEVSRVDKLGKSVLSLLVKLAEMINFQLPLG